MIYLSISVINKLDPSMENMSKVDYKFLCFSQETTKIKKK